MSTRHYDVHDLSLAKEGQLRIEWASRQMPVINLIRQRFQREKPLRGIIIAACLHVTAETANLILTLKAGGAKVVLCASNPLSTQDEVAASLVKHYRFPVFARRGEDKQTYYRHIAKVLSYLPQITIDDGADLVSTLHQRDKLPSEIIGGTEETTTGVLRLRSLEREGVLRYPIVAVNDAQTKYMFDNRYGTGQSTIDGIIRATNILLAGSNFVVHGYGWCGRGLAMRARGMGANVIVTEVNPLRAMEALMDGYRVMPSLEAAPIGDIFVTLTGDINVLTREHFAVMHDGAIICNSGHFNVEINIPALETMSVRKRKIRGLIEEYTMKDGRRICLLGEGRLINLVAAEGHPPSVMDMSFSNQALSIAYLVKNGKKLEKRVYPVPPKIDQEVAILKLTSLGIKIDHLTQEQQKYLSSWEVGT